MILISIQQNTWAGIFQEVKRFKLQMGTGCLAPLGAEKIPASTAHLNASRPVDFKPSLPIPLIQEVEEVL